MPHTSGRGQLNCVVRNEDMDLLEELQNWYLSRCNGDWEHQYGIHIDTLDNPGWLLKVDLQDTGLAGKEFHGVEDLEGEADWFCCKIQDAQFVGACGPKMLGKVLRIFLDWTKEA